MPLHLEALTEHGTTEILTWILQNPLQNANDAFGSQKNEKIYAVVSYPLSDSTTREEIGKYVFTVFTNMEQQCNEIIDIDIVLNNTNSTKLLFENRLSQSSDSNEYYEVVTKELDQHLVVETVNRYTVPDEIEGKEKEVFVSAFPFELTIFETVEAYNKFCGFEKPVGGRQNRFEDIRTRNHICLPRQYAGANRRRSSLVIYRGRNS